jgi:hypothetical protein
MFPHLGLNHSQSTPAHLPISGVGPAHESIAVGGAHNLINHHLHKGLPISNSISSNSTVGQSVHPLLAVQTQLSMLKSQLAEGGAEINPAKHRWYLGVLEGGLEGLQNQLEKGLIVGTDKAEKKQKQNGYKEWRRDLIYIKERKAKKLSAEYSERQQAKQDAEIKANPIPGLNPLSFVSKQIR